MARHLPLTCAVLLGCALAPLRAHAQSTRYPPDAADVDRDADQRSGLWDSAVDPQRAPYEQALATAARALQDPSEHAAQEAITALDDAIRLVPGDPRAYALRGDAYLVVHDWPQCAADLEAWQARDATDSTDRDRRELELGICQSRAGRLADAERTLVHAATRAVPHGEAWVRLGEVRIALGKLAEAIDALTAALDTNEGRSPTAHWLLALAYDRARVPAPERGEPGATDAEIALALDGQLAQLENPPYPWLGDGEHEYLMGLAYATQSQYAQIRHRPEYALLYFRRFVAMAPGSPWRARALEHVQALEKIPFPETVAIDRNSSAAVDPVQVRAAITRAMPGMRACAAHQLTAAYEVSIVKDGPRSPDSPDRTRYAMRPEGTRIDLDLDIGAPTPGATVDATRACLAKAVAQVRLPAPAEADTYYAASFFVIAP